MHQTFTKPAKGSALLERRGRKAERNSHEKAEKRAVMLRDGHQCRWPACEFRSLKVRIEAAHVMGHKGWGGNPANDRSERHMMLALCFLHHQGAVSLHSGDLRVESMTERHTDGPMAFYRKAESGKWVCVAVESAIGVSEVRGL